MTGGNMSVLIVLVSRRLIFAGIVGLWLLARDPAAAADPSKTLQDIAAWDSHGLGSGTMVNATAEKNRFSGKLQIKNIPDELFPEVIGFKSDSQRQYNIALIFPGKCLMLLLPELKEAAVADVEMPQLVVLLTPPANTGGNIQLPEQVGAVKMPFVGGTQIKLEAGATVLSHANIGGQTAALLHAIGVPLHDITVTGTIDPRILSGAGMKNPQLQKELINGIDLKLTLSALALDRKPSYLTFGDSTLMMKGNSGKFTMTIATSLTVNAGSGVHFDTVTIHRDPVKGLITITSTPVPGSNFITLPIADAAIREVTFHGLIDEQKRDNDLFTLAGKYSVQGSSPRDFIATLSGGTPARYEVTVQTDTTLGKLLGWPAPGLNALVIENVSFGNGYIQGNLRLKGRSFVVVLFKGAGQTKYNAAFLSTETFTLPKLMTGLQGTPLADLDLSRPGFVLVPPENAGHAVKLPEAVSHHFGMMTLDVKPGLNVIAHADAHGTVGGLLQSVGLPSSKLVITGNLDPAILADGDSPLTDTFVNAISLQILLPAATTDRKPPYLTFGDSTVMIKGVSGKIASGIMTSLKVNAGSGVHFDKVTINRDPIHRLVTITSSIITPGASVITLPMSDAAVSEVAFHGLIDEQKKANDSFTLAGKYSVHGSKPQNFTATLSGGTPAHYLITLQTDTSLGQMLGWSVPGLDALLLTEVSFGNGFIQGNLTFKGMNFVAVLFKGTGQTKNNIAFLSTESFRLPKMMAGLQDTPLADLELVRPGFVLVPPENAGTAIKLPDAVSRHIGVPKIDLRKGLNVFANGNVSGEPALLLDKLGINPTGLPVSGTIDWSVFSNINGGALAQPFLDALDLRLALPKFSLPGIAHNVTFDNGYLALKGIERGIDTSVVTKITVIANGSSPLVFDAGLRLIKDAGGTTVSLSGDYHGAWKKPLGLVWLTIRNVRIAGSLGATANTLALSGTTDVGRLRNLIVSLDLAAKNDGETNVALQLTGADISLADIPELSSVPHSGDLTFRDLLISSHAIGGTLKSTKLRLLHNVQAVAFEHEGHWNLAALLGDVELSKLMMLPTFARPVLGKMKLGRTVLLLNRAGINGRIGDLPTEVQAQLTGIFDSPADMIRTTSGVNLITQLDPSSMGPAVTTFLPPGQTVVLQGSVGGVVGGGVPTLELSATIPAVALPSSLGFIKLPSNARTAFFVTLTRTTASSGVVIETVIGARLNKQTVDFDSTIAFELDNQGGVAVDVQGKSLNQWHNVMGINGLSLDTGSRIEVKTAASSGQTLTFVGKTHIGSREADVTGYAGIIGGVVDKGAFEVKLDKLTLSDIMALFNDAVKAGGRQPVKADFPDATFTNVDIAFASPGANVPEMGLPDGGTRLAGDLWFLLKDKPLTRVKALISESSLVMTGDISDFSIGPVALKGNSLDINARTMPPKPPQFKIRGTATIMGKHASGEIDSGLEDTAVVSSLDLGGLLNLDLHAGFATPVSGLAAGALASQDMALNATLKSDIGAWLRGEGKKAVAEVFKSVGSDIKKLAADFDTAKTKVDSLNGDLGKARKRADAGAKTVDQQIAMAQKKVNDLTDRVGSLNQKIASEKDDIHGCNYSIKICYWWNWRGHCTKHKDVPDVARDAECEVNNSRHAATIAAYETALKAAQTAKAAAETVLAGLKKGEKGVDIASLDPEVIALEATLVTANLTLDAAKKLAQGAELGVGQLEAGLKALDSLDTFKLTGSSLSGSFQKAVAGKPVVLGLDFEAAGKSQHLRLAFSLTDPKYNTDQLDTLALLVAKDAVEALPAAAPVVTHLLNAAFKSSYEKADKEADKVAADNGLE